jgi:selenium metabolism protein YedF
METEPVKQTIDARGLPCPQPVVRTKRALAEGGFDILEVIVDNRAAVVNVSRYVEHAGFQVAGTEESEDSFIISILTEKSETAGASAEERAFSEALSACAAPQTESKNGVAGKTVFIAGDAIGEGERELGRLLMGAFIFTLSELEVPPRRLILMNSGVRLAVEEAKELADLKKLESAGVKIIACGTCLDYYDIKERLRAGSISNMYDIAEKLLEGDTISI